MATPEHSRSLFAETFLFFILILSTTAAWVFSTATAKSVPLPPLRFKNSNGQFKILQVADMHYADGQSTKCLDVFPSQVSTCSDLNTTAFIKRMIKAEQPDLIVFTGDNIFGADTKDPATSLKAAFEPAVSAKLPWAAVLGNHDQESILTRKQVMEHIVPMEYTLSKVNPHFHGKKIDGFGNYNLEVKGMKGSKLEGKSVLNLYFLDSGDYSTDPNITGYGWIKPSQQAWFKETSDKLQALTQVLDLRWIGRRNLSRLAGLHTAKKGLGLTLTACLSRLAGSSHWTTLILHRADNNDLHAHFSRARSSHHDLHAHFSCARSSHHDLHAHFSRAR